jgi:hypothetical protein
MTRHTLSLSALLLLGLAPAAAHAEDVETFRYWVKHLREEPGKYATPDLPPVAECRAAAGADDALCDEYATRAAIWPAAAKQHATSSSLGSYSQVDPADFGDGMGQGFVDDGKACHAATDAAIAAGAPDDVAVVIDGVSRTLAQGKVEICDAMVAFGQRLIGDIAAAHAAARAEIAAKYEAVGVKGQRLELFIEYDDVYWRGKGCERITDLKKLARAKVLFHWLENSDGTHTIRKYTFKGNKVKSIKDRTYATEARAWKGCK